MKTKLAKGAEKKFLNELTSSRTRYRPVKEEDMPSGFFSTASLAKKYGIAHRVSQRWVSESLSLKELEVRFVRRKTNEFFVRKIPVYKFKTKTDEKSFKSRHKGKL